MIPRRRKRPRRVDPERCQGHLQFVRGFDCSVAGCKETPVDPHHVRLGNLAGASRKPPDDQAIPLCRMHHSQLDSWGWSEARFYAHYKLDTAALVRWFQDHSPPLRRRRAA